jgi:hypothetical protein
MQGGWEAKKNSPTYFSKSPSAPKNAPFGACSHGAPNGAPDKNWVHNMVQRGKEIGDFTYGQPFIFCAAGPTASC